MSKKNKPQIFAKSFLNSLCEHDRLFVERIEEAIITKLDGTKRYGFECWCSLGSKGLFADINRKYHRLKNDIWDDEQELSSENLRDTCKDLTVYAIFMMMALEKEKRIRCTRRGQSKSN